MKLLKLVPEETQIAFIRYRFIGAVFSAAMIVLSLGLFFTLGLNKGIDFEGGILIEVGTEAPADLGRFRSTLAGLALGDVAVQSFGTPNEVLIRIERQPAAVSQNMTRAEIVKAEQEAQQQTVEQVQAALNAIMEGLSYRRVEFVGPKVSGELVDFGRQESVPFHFLMGELLELLQGVAEELGTTEEINHVHTILARGTSADRQLKVYRQHGGDENRKEALQAVVDFLIEETRIGV